MLRPTPVPRPLESTDTQTRTDGQCWLEATPPFPSALRGKNGQLSPNTAFPGARLVRTGRALGVGVLGLTQRAGLEREGCCPFCPPQLPTCLPGSWSPEWGCLERSQNVFIQICVFSFL